MCLRQALRPHPCQTSTTRLGRPPRELDPRDPWYGWTRRSIWWRFSPLRRSLSNNRPARCVRSLLPANNTYGATTQSSLLQMILKRHANVIFSCTVCALISFSGIVFIYFLIVQDSRETNMDGHFKTTILHLNLHLSCAADRGLERRENITLKPVHT